MIDEGPSCNEASDFKLCTDRRVILKIVLCNLRKVTLYTNKPETFHLSRNLTLTAVSFMCIRLGQFIGFISTDIIRLFYYNIPLKNICATSFPTVNTYVYQVQETSIVLGEVLNHLSSVTWVWHSNNCFSKNNCITPCERETKLLLLKRLWKSRSKSLIVFLPGNRLIALKGNKSD